MARLRNPSGATSTTEAKKEKGGRKGEMPNKEKQKKKSEKLIHCHLPALQRTSGVHKCGSTGKQRK